MMNRQTADAHRPGSETDSPEWENWMDWDCTGNSTSDHVLPDNASSNSKTEQLSSTTRSRCMDAQSPKKRRFSSRDETSIQASSQMQEPSKQAKSHSIVEKRYRMNLNQKITDLATCLPNLRMEVTTQDQSSQTCAAKHNKATVLTEAMAYIRYLEDKNGLLERANAALRDRYRSVASQVPISGESLEGEAFTSSTALLPDAASHDGALVLASPCDREIAKPTLLEPVSLTEGDAVIDPPKKPQGMINVPEEFRRMWNTTATQPSNADQHAHLNGSEEGTSSGSVTLKGSKHVGRLVIGSFAGLMVLDALTSRCPSEREDHGLFAVPSLPFLPRLTRLSTKYKYLRDLHHFCPVPSLLLAFLVFSALGLMLFTYLFTSKPNPKRPRASVASSPVLALSLPLEVRQRAWLTSIQTVWVPGHHALPELAALVIETVTYLTRQLLGWDRYARLTGRSEAEELARIRAWDVAIDAQLSGGDQEISRSRLVLTLWAAGTLPDSPARLMLKALHIRILFYQPSRFPFVCRVLRKAAMRLARYQWTKALVLHQQLSSNSSSENNEALSKHLVALLQQSSDSSMTDTVIHRAYNLAWNHSVSGDVVADNMGEVIENSAMCGPLDALASGFSSYKLDKALRDFTNSGKQEWNNPAYSNLHSAINTAPPGSVAEAYALAAHEILTETSIKGSIKHEDFSLALKKIVEFSKSQRGVSHDHNDSGYDSDLNER